MEDKKALRELYKKIQLDLDKEVYELSRYKNLTNKTDKLDDALHRKLPKEDYRVFEDYMNNYFDIMYLCSEEAFIKGFSLSTKFREEALEK